MEAASDNAESGTPQTLGGTLAAERERQGLSRADAAQRLHMSPTQVEALERGDYTALPKGTFLRGFVRNYAKVLGLDSEPLLAMLAEGVPRDPAPRIIVPTQNIRFDPLGERLSSPYVKAATLAVVAVAIAFAAMYWWVFVRPKPPALAAHTPPVASRTEPAPAMPPAPPDAAPAPSEPPAHLVAPPEEKPKASATGKPSEEKSKAPAAGRSASAKGASSPPAPTPLPATASSSIASAPAAPASVPTQPTKVADAAAKPAKSGPRKALHFRFAGDSWVEIRDANGKVLYQKLNAAGSEADVAARPPVDVIVGNAPEVRMTLDGADFPLEPHTNVAVARFTLE